MSYSKVCLNTLDKPKNGNKSIEYIKLIIKYFNHLIKNSDGSNMKYEQIFQKLKKNKYF